MIYLVLSFFFLFAAFYILYASFETALGKLYSKQKFYEGTVKNKKNIILLHIVNFSQFFVPVLKKIKLKIFVDYINKVDNMLKIFDFEDNLKINAYNFIFIQIVCFFFGVFCSFLVFDSDLFFMFCLGLLFLILPYIKLYEEYNKIKTSIVKQLPDVANLLAILIYSGIDFIGAVNKITNILDGYLIKEIRSVADKISLGLDTKMAFNDMAAKYDLQQLNTFVKALNISLDTGTGLTDSLYKISEQINNDNVAAAEKKAHEAPIKMLIPMTLLILPTIFILLFAPFVISFIKSGSIL